MEKRPLTRMIVADDTREIRVGSADTLTSHPYREAGASGLHFGMPGIFRCCTGLEKQVRPSRRPGVCTLRMAGVSPVRRLEPEAYSCIFIFGLHFEGLFVSLVTGLRSRVSRIACTWLFGVQDQSFGNRLLGTIKSDTFT